MAIGHALDIESWLEGSNQVEFAKERGEFGGLFFENDFDGGLDDASGFFIFIVGHEVAEQASAEGLGFADVDQSSQGIDHAVDARMAWGIGADGGAKFVGGGTDQASHGRRWVWHQRIVSEIDEHILVQECFHGVILPAPRVVDSVSRLSRIGSPSPSAYL